jgi:gentisate 1,2-dioxygenase
MSEEVARRAYDADQTAFQQRLGALNLGALWVGRRGVDLSQPRSPAAPALWRYGDIRPSLEEAGRLIRAEEAFRRVLVMENPAFPGEMRATQTLYAGLQLVLPGEIAPCHRHSQTAFRFVLEGEGAFTSVDGERAWMRRGDFIVTPCWSWHDHANESDGPVVWLDVLDTPLVGFLDTVFRESHDRPRQTIDRPDGMSPARFGAGMLPVGYEGSRAASPVFSYPYGRSRAALAALARSTPPDACHGLKMAYIDPATGGPATPTMGACLQLLPAGFDGAEYRATDSAVYAAVEGRGRVRIGDETIEWGPNDVFVVPGWRRHALAADEDAVLFSVSERPVHEALGLWREERFDRQG